MHIVIFSDCKNLAYHRLNQAISSLNTTQTIEVHDEIGLFVQRFRVITVRPDLIILVPNSPEELCELLIYRELFENYKIIIILPNREKETLSKSHQFHPSFITFEDEDFNDVATIIRHMDNKLNQRDESIVFV